MLPACTTHLTQPPDTDLQRVHPGGAHRLAFDPSGKRLASGGLRGKVYVWSVEDVSPLLTLAEHRAPIRGLAWLDDQRLLSADRSGQIYIWDLRSARVVGTSELGALSQLVLAPDRSWLLAIEGTHLHKLALPSLQRQARIDTGRRLLSVAVSHATGRIALSSHDGRVWLLDTGLKDIGELPRPSRDALDLRFSPDDRTLLAGGWFRLLVWDLERQRLEERRTEHLGKVVSVDISPGGEHWLSLGRTTDSNFRLIDADSNRVLRRFEPHELCGWQARFSPDGRYAASAAEDGSIHIYDLNAPYRPEAPSVGFDD